jgi:hypothetical protein
MMRRFKFYQAPERFGSKGAWVGSAANSHIRVVLPRTTAILCLESQATGHGSGLNLAMAGAQPCRRRRRLASARS